MKKEADKAANCHNNKTTNVSWTRWTKLAPGGLNFESFGTFSLVERILPADFALCRRGHRSSGIGQQEKRLEERDALLYKGGQVRL